MYCDKEVQDLEYKYEFDLLQPRSNVLKAYTGNASAQSADTLDPRARLDKSEVDSWRRTLLPRARVKIVSPRKTSHRDHLGWEKPKLSQL